MHCSIIQATTHAYLLQQQTAMTVQFSCTVPVGTRAQYQMTRTIPKKHATILKAVMQNASKRGALQSIDSVGGTVVLTVIRSIPVHGHNQRKKNKYRGIMFDGLFVKAHKQIALAIGAFCLKVVSYQNGKCSPSWESSSQQSIFATKDWRGN